MRKWTLALGVLVLLALVALWQLSQKTPAQRDGGAEAWLSSALKGGEHLLRALDAQGKFNYLYDAKTGESSSSYNNLRHSGAAYALLQLYEVTGRREFLEGAQSAIQYLVNAFVKPCDFKGQSLLCAVEDGEVKLGGNALAVIAMVKYTELTQDAQYLETAIRLGRWMQLTQDETGRFTVHIQLYPTSWVTGFVSGYYPGEAMLALLRLYQLTHEVSWLDTASRAADYLIHVRDGEKTIEELDHDHWLLISLNELHRQRPEQAFLDHALKLFEAIEQGQNKGPQNPLWLGSWYTPPRSTPASTRVEGLVAAYQLVRDFKPEAAAPILRAAKLGGAFILKNQLSQEDNVQPLGWGGFRESLDGYELRIDYTQHAVSALLGLHQITQ